MQTFVIMFDFSSDKLNKTQHCSFLYFFELIFPLNEPINLYFCT